MTAGSALALQDDLRRLRAYGGDSGTAANYRQGTLYFYNNTMVTRGDAGHGLYPEVLLFNLNMPGAPKFDTKPNSAPVLTIPAQWNQGLSCGSEDFM